MKKIVLVVATFIVLVCCLFLSADSIFADDFNVKPDSFSGLTDLPYAYSGYTFNKRVIFYNQEDGWYAKDFDSTMIPGSQCDGSIGVCVFGFDANPLAFYHPSNPHIRQFEWNDSTHQWAPDTYSTSTGYKLNVNHSIADDILYSTMDVKYYYGASNTNYTNATYYGGVNFNNGAVIFSANDHPTTPLSFPLNVDCSGVACTPYTTPISSTMDQSTLGTGATYGAGEDSVVETFEGEVGDVGPYSGSTCYRKSDNSAFGISFNYVGTSGTGGAYYMCYDAHPGYDYPQDRYTDIYSPAVGTLCVATTYTAQRNPSNVWRYESECPLPSVVSTRWQDSGGYNTFYIIHKGLYINGSTNDYMTVFLHSDDLESSVRSAIEQYGYMLVTRNQHIAEVGGQGPSGPTTYGFHMHFEVYKKNGENWDRVDPYGDGTNNILWKQ